MNNIKTYEDLSRWEGNMVFYNSIREYPAIALVLILAYGFGAYMLYKVLKAAFKGWE